MADVQSLWFWFLNQCQKISPLYWQWRMGKEKKGGQESQRETSAWVGVRTLSLHLIVLCYCLLLMTEETIASPTEAIFTSQMSSKDWQGWGKIKSDGGKTSSHQRTAPGPAGVALGRKQHGCYCHCWRQESQTEWGNSTLSFFMMSCTTSKKVTQR